MGERVNGVVAVAKRWAEHRTKPHAKGSRKDSIAKANSRVDGGGKPHTRIESGDNVGPPSRIFHWRSNVFADVFVPKFRMVFDE